MRTLTFGLTFPLYTPGVASPITSPKSATTSRLFLMMEHGCLAVAMVQRQVMIVQASRSHSSREAWLDVHTFMPFGSNVFLPSPVPQARISSADILTIFPSSDKLAHESAFGNDVLEISPRAYEEFVELSSRMQKKYERLFDVWSKKSRR